MTTTSTASTVSAGLCLLLPIALAGQALGQCSVNCVPGGRVPDADGAVNASCTWDPDGPGPQPAVVVLGGAFQVVGNAVARGLALYDPGTGECTSLGTGVSGSVTALAVLPNNDLVVAGIFQSIDGVAATNVARWDGSSWLPMAAGLPFTPWAMTLAANGDPIAAGYTALGAQRVLRWNGTNWVAMGNGLTGTVWALATLPNGDVIAGGSLVLPGPNNNLARWDGVSWSVFAGNVDGGVLALLPLPNGDLIAGGGFLNAGGVATSSIARWDGTTWSGLGGGIFNPVYSLANLPNGDLVAGGLFGAAGGVPANQVARWDGTAWSSMGSGLGISAVNPAVPVRTLLPLPNGDVVAGGSFLSIGGDVDYVARWNGSAWAQIRSGTGGAVLASAEAANGDLLVVGDFTTIEGVAANRVARRSGGIWQALGSGADGAVNAVLQMPNGDIVIGGAFTSVGGVAANRIARWDGTQWWPIGGGLPATVNSLAIGAGPQILASGTFLDRVAVWDGQAWNGTGIAGSLFGSRLLTLADGSVFAPSAGRWNGVVWVPVPGVSGTAGLLALALAPNGDWFGSFSASGVRRWNGTTWVTLGGTFNGTIADLLVLPNGDLLAGGNFTTIATVPIVRLARWDGTAWSPVGAGASAAVADLRFGSNGRVFVSGSFASLVGTPCSSFGELATTCPATAATAGAGCIGSGGANVLAATSLPWTGATFTSLATGMPANGLAIEVLGLGALSQPLPAVLPQGVAGCVLATTPDLLNLRVPAAGALPLQLVLPDSASLVGASLRQQVVPFEIDAQGAIAAVTATNALQLTLGRF